MTYLTLLLVVFYNLHTKVILRLLSSTLDNCTRHNLNTYCHWIPSSSPKHWTQDQVRSTRLKRVYKNLEKHL